MSQAQTKAEIQPKSIDEMIEIVIADYAKFPEAQTYAIYAEDVYFKDPVYEFRGLKQYQKMIGFITKWFANLNLALHTIEEVETSQSNPTEGVTTIKTEWTMSWNSPMPWKPRISVDGWSELGINHQGQIISHVDYWHCTKWDVVKQHIPFLSNS
ncbi:Protein of unknown function DUF2358 [Thalassoporum mexicanum PCC 7367]|uniref:DUF2358 domain-containing protein n=1 Tax=Thalassoporum mexicanum TaxID=3457544 RepID=UPI00029F8F38|nr:DUF2358 domain-containing protein [Pseudanabaena sp. PCC 7367]AFY70544.1 Protein of unknown function DUF2358 [Pseudanabaena sp. PCC 7367]